MLSSFSPLDHLVSHTLSNGLRVLLKEDHSWPLVSAQAWVHVGSVDETPVQAGISHVIEHMVFKGTARYQAADIARWIEVLGGAMNAETSKEYTHYYIDIPSAGAEKAVNILGELLHRALFDPGEWQRECAVILEEIKRRNDDPESVLWELLNDAVFREVRLKRPVIGSVETVAGLAREDLWAFYRAFYRTGSSLVIIAGDFEPRRMLRWIETAFDGMPEGAPPERPAWPVQDQPPQHRSMRQPVQQTYSALGFPTPPSNHPDQEALDILAAVLGEGRGSQLVQLLREKKKLVWSVSAANYGHEGPGVFGIFAESTAANQKRVYPEIDRLLKRLRHQKLTGSEVSRAKNLIESAWLQSFETYHQQASTIGIYALDHQLDRLRNYLNRLKALTPAALSAAADRYLDPKHLSSALIGADV